MSLYIYTGQTIVVHNGVRVN